MTKTSRGSGASVAVVGGGAGGLVAACYLAKTGHDVTLFEAKERVGGCASRFPARDFHFLAGATTLVGLEPDMPLGIVLQELGLAPRATPLERALTIWHRGHALRLGPNTDQNVALLSSLYGESLGRHWNAAMDEARRAWRLITEAPFPPASIRDLVTLAGSEKAWSSLPAMLRSAGAALRSAGPVTPAARELLDALLMISTQTTADETPALFGAVGLEYLQRPLYLAEGGLGGFLERLADHASTLGVTIRRSEPVTALHARGTGWTLHTAEDRYETDGALLALTHWDAAKITTGNVQRYFARIARRHPDGWGACCLYLGAQDVFGEDVSMYHQVVLEEPLATSGARSLFVTLSPRGDRSFAPPGYRAITVSCHTDAAAWARLDDDAHDQAKRTVTKELYDAIVQIFPELSAADAPVILAATPRTWQAFTGRALGRVGGLPFTYGTLLRGYPTGRTPFPHLRRVGDTVFPGQSVVAVAWGARRAARELTKELQRL